MQLINKFGWGWRLCVQYGTVCPYAVTALADVRVPAGKRRHALDAAGKTVAAVGTRSAGALSRGCSSERRRGSRTGFPPLPRQRIKSRPGPVNLGQLPRSAGQRQYWTLALVPLSIRAIGISATYTEERNNGVTRAIQPPLLVPPSLPRRRLALQARFSSRRDAQDYGPLISFSLGTGLTAAREVRPRHWHLQGSDSEAGENGSTDPAVQRSE